MNVNPLIWRAVAMSGEVDGALWLALKRDLNFDALLDLLEMQDAAADAREAERKQREIDAAIERSQRGAR